MSRRNLLPKAYAFDHIAAFYKFRAERAHTYVLLRSMIEKQDLYRKFSFGEFM